MTSTARGSVEQGSPDRAASQRARRSGLRERKRTETRRRIAEEAVRLVSAQGIPATTVEQIADAAGVGRATFFRYYESKELAIATGLSEVAVYVFSAVLDDLPSDLGPLEAVRAAHESLAHTFDADRQMYLEQALLSRSSPAMFAWTLHFYVDWEIAIANSVAARFDDLVPGDPRPRMVGAMAMAAARLACDEWVADGGTGHLPTIMVRHLAALELPARSPAA